MIKKKKWSSEAKFKIALEAIKGDITLSDLCSKYEVAPSQIHTWKRQLLEQGSKLFDKSKLPGIYTTLKNNMTTFRMNDTTKSAF